MRGWTGIGGSPARGHRPHLIVEVHREWKVLQAAKGPDDGLAGGRIAYEGFVVEPFRGERFVCQQDRDPLIEIFVTGERNEISQWNPTRL